MSSVEHRGDSSSPELCVRESAVLTGQMRQHAGTRITSMLGAANATPGGRFPYAGWRDETAALAIASEGALTLIGASLNKLVFSTILRSRRRPMQEASAY